jgi:heterodisulfide reductase subunit B
MRLREFIRKNKEEIDDIIKSACPNCKLNNDERENWIMNDEGLYIWAKSEGVRLC